MFEPGYLKLHRSGELKKREDVAYAMLKSCELCPRCCRVNRLEGEKGFCRTGSRPIVSSYNPHFGEEAPLVGRHGSGTIFFSNCNLGCVFCQNYDISHLSYGVEVTSEALADMMLALQMLGCHNINFVTPTHVVPSILAALAEAVEGGLHVPLVYNCGGYESIATLKLLEGIVDIYMPDFKFAGKETAQKYARVPDYFEAASRSLKEMHRQVGDLELDKKGIARRGLLVRHLVMPNDVAGTEKILSFIAEQISPDTYVNIMAQYRPCGKAQNYPEIDRPITREEYETALLIAQKVGLRRLD